MSEKTPFVPPELGPLNIRPPKAWAMSADDHWQSNPWYEAPRDDPSLPEVYTYTDAMSYDQTTRSSSIRRRPLRTGPSRSIATVSGLRPFTRSRPLRASTRQRRQRPIAPAAAGRSRIAGACRKTSARGFTGSSRLARAQTSASSSSIISLSCGRRMRRGRRRFWSSCPRARGLPTTISEAPIIILAWPGRSAISPRRCFPLSGRGRAALSGCRLARRASARIPFRNSATLRVIRRWNGRTRTVSASITPPPAGRSSIGTSSSGRRRRATNSISSRRQICTIGLRCSTPIPA